MNLQCGSDVRRNIRVWPLLWVFLLLGVMPDGGMAAAAGDQGRDPVLQALQEYARESVTVGGSKDYEKYRESFLRGWFDRLWTLREQYPNSTRRNDLTTALLGLANGLELHEASEGLATELLESSHDAESANRWHHELGDIQYREYLRTGDTAHANDALQHFDTAVKLMEVSSDPAYADQRAVHVMSDIQHLADLKSTVVGDFASSADLYRRGNTVLAGLSDQRRASLSARGWSSEFWLSSEMVASAKGGMIARAEEALRELSALDNLRWPPTYYMCQLASVRFPTGGAAFREALNAWFQKAPADRWTPVLLFNVARDWEREGAETEALPYYWRMVNEERYRSALEKMESDALEKGRGGYLSIAIQRLVYIFASLGNELEAKAYAEEFLRLFPNGERAKEMRAYLGHPLSKLYEVNAGAQTGALHATHSHESPRVDVGTSTENTHALPLSSQTKVDSNRETPSEGQRPTALRMPRGGSLALLIVVLLAAIVSLAIRQGRRRNTT